MKIDLEDALWRVDEMREVDSDEGVANALMRLGAAYLQRDKLNLAAEAFDEAYYICDKLDNQPGCAQVCLRMAEVELGRGRFEAADDWLHKGLKIFKALKDLSGQVECLENLAKVAARMGQEKEALSRLEDALKILKRDKDEVGQVLVLTQMASLKRAMAEYDQAGRMYQKVLDITYALGDMDRTAFALVGVGTCLILGGNTQAGIKALKEAEDLYRKQGQISRAEQVAAERERLSAAAAKNQQAEDDS